MYRAAVGKSRRGDSASAAVTNTILTSEVESVVELAMFLSGSLS